MVKSFDDANDGEKAFGLIFIIVGVMMMLYAMFGMKSKDGNEILVGMIGLGLGAVGVTMFTVPDFHLHSGNKNHTGSPTKAPA